MSDKHELPNDARSATFRKIEELPVEAQALVIEFVDMLRTHHTELPIGSLPPSRLQTNLDTHLRSLFGSEHIGTSSDNTVIDRDLAREYLDSH
jgi:hypothetical protein